MASLASAANVWETCLQLLRRRGYHLEVSCSDEDRDELDLWSAAKDGFTFVGDNPIELLGLVAVYEDVRPEEDLPYWWSANTDPDSLSLYEQLIEEAVAAQEAPEALPD